jgi:hypothetical protein
MRKRSIEKVLVIGSGPNAAEAADFPRSAFDSIVAINNAWQVRPDWDYSIFPPDFPPEKRAPEAKGSQSLISTDEYLPAMNRAGGLPLCGATMAFAAGYWALHGLAPRVIAFIGCDMDYTPKEGKTHFYGTGTPDPLRKNISLRNLQAKSGRLFLKGLRENTLFVNLSTSPKSELLFPRASVPKLESLARARSVVTRQLLHKSFWKSSAQAVRASMLEKKAPEEYTQSKVYWKFNDRDDIQVVVDQIDTLWQQAALGMLRAF